MRRVIMLLPNPDVLQLANCHKYVSRQDDKAYSDIFTMTTIVGACGDTDKILVIGHGQVGGFHGASVDRVVRAIIESGISLTGGKKIGFDTCFAGSRQSNHGIVSSALHQVRVRLKKYNFDCNLELSGATGPSVTIGNVGDKRLVVDPVNLPHAGALQGGMTGARGLDLFEHRPDWQERAPSKVIKVWAQQEHARLIGFASAFRTALAPDLDISPNRKVTLQV